MMYLFIFINTYPWYTIDLVRGSAVEVSLLGTAVFDMSEQEHVVDPSNLEYLKQLIKEKTERNNAPFFERLSAAHDEVLAEFSKYWKQLVWNAPSIVQGFKGFVKDIDWSEKWIQSILAVQACILLTLILFRNNMVVQNTIFILSGMFDVVLYVSLVEIRILI